MRDIRHPHTTPAIQQRAKELRQQMTLAEEKLWQRTRRNDPLVVARIEDGRLVLDPRTVQVREEKALLEAVLMAVG